jgi:hypothetical protein
MIALGNHQAARDGSDAALDEAGMVIENKTVDARVVQQRLRPGQANDIVGAQQFQHPQPTGLRLPYVKPAYVNPAYVRHLTRSVILCSLANKRVKLNRPPRDGTDRT